MTMIERIKKDWRLCAQDTPGERFARRYERKRREAPGLMGRIAWVLTGLFFVLIGFVMLFTPGPGLLALGFGATCLAQESRALARRCDAAEMRLRGWYARFRRWRD